MVYFYTTLTILVLLSYKAKLIFRSDNHLGNSNGNCEDNLEEGCLSPDFHCHNILSNQYLDYMTCILFYRVEYMPD